MNESRSLVIVRTPLQAWLVKKVLIEESVDKYDLLYFTRNDSEEDQYYFSTLKLQAEECKYLFVGPKRFDIISHICFRWMARYWCFDRAYDKVFLASINAHVPNSVATAQEKSELITFDDGAANISILGAYHKQASSLRLSIYRKLLGAVDIEILKRKISKHYTLYPNLDNIVEKTKLRSVPGWSSRARDNNSNNTKTYFIGQPFEEVLTVNQITVIESYLKTLDIDFYVRHPRERNVLDIGVPLLEKGGFIAEDAIVKNAGGTGIHLIGGFSTVLFNLGELAQKRTMLFPADQPGATSRVELARMAGCDIVMF